jgi:predicted porin
MTISSDTFGQLDIGSENSAGYKMMVGAPGVTSMYINSPSISAFVPFSAVLPANFRQAAISSYTEVAGNNDVNRITYYTPNFNGFMVGFSYAPDNTTNSNEEYQVDQNQAIKDIWDIAVSYSQSFGTTDVSFAARYGAGTAPSGFHDPETWGVGFQIGFNGFTFGGSWSENENAGANQPSWTGAPDQEGWSLGMTYDMAGPWSFEALTYQGEYSGSGTNGADEEYIAYRVGASRDLGPGVDWDVYLAFVEADDKGLAGTELDGTILGTAINLSF